MRVRLIFVLLSALATSLLALAPGALASPAAADPVPRCTDISFKGNTGQINLRTSPNRTVAWNIAMDDDSRNDGPWTVDVYVNNRRVDHKEQSYQPHGSISPKQLPPSSFINIEAFHVDLYGTEHTFVPNQCYLP